MYFVQKKNLQEEDSQYQEDRKLDLIHYQMVIFQSLNLLNVIVTDSVIKMIYLCIHPVNICIWSYSTRWNNLAEKLPQSFRAMHYAIMRGIPYQFQDGARPVDSLLGL